VTFPCIVVDIETTGLPGKPPGWIPRVVEVGAVVVTADLQVVGDMGFEVLVRQDEAHLRDPRAAGAWGLSDLTPEFVLAQGIAEPIAALRFALWLGWARAAHGAMHLRAFNEAFDFGFLRKAPWHIDQLRPPGPCIMLEATEAMDREGVLPRWADGSPKWAKSEEAEAFYRARGHAIPTEGTAHRALRDALVEAHIAVAIERERRTP